MANYRPNVILSTHSMCTIQAFLLKHWWNVPWVAVILDVPKFRFREPWSSNLMKYYRVDVKAYWNEWQTIFRCLKAADAVIAISQKTKSDLEDFGVDVKAVCYLGADTEVADECLSKPCPIQLPDDYFTCIQNLNDHKRVDMLIHACQETGSELLVMGDGPQKHELETMAKGDDNIKLMGAVEEAVKWHVIKNSTALLTASIWEGFYIPGCEANYVGRPVLAYDLEVLREIYGDKIFYYKTFGELCEKLEWLKKEKPAGDREWVLKSKLTLRDAAERVNEVLLGAAGGE